MFLITCLARMLSYSDLVTKHLRATYQVEIEQYKNIFQTHLISKKLLLFNHKYR